MNESPGESPEQFVERLRRYLEKWRVMAKYEACYDSLEGMKTHDKPNHTVHLMFDFVVRTEV